MTIPEYAHYIVKNLITEFPGLYKSMLQVTHNKEQDNILSDWHLEGSIWTHTMMVVAAMRESLKEGQRYKELLLAALLHDVGKVYTGNIDEEKQKITFYGHPGVSTYIAKDMLSVLDPTLTKDQQIYVLRIINYHQVLFNLTKDMSDKAFKKILTKFDDDEGCFLLPDIVKMRNADSAGRISKGLGRLDADRLEELECLLIDNYMDREVEGTSTTEYPNAVIMVGLPGVGKSTYVKEFYKDYTVISRDAQVELLATDGMTYTEAFASVDQKQVDTMYEELLNKTLQKKENLVIDKTNLTHKSRMKSITRLRDNGYIINIIVLLPSMQTLYERNQAREGKIIPDSVVKRMKETFEMPFDSEGGVEYIFDF